MALIDLSSLNTLFFDMYSSRTGSNLKVGLHNAYTKLCSHFDGADGATAYTDPIAGAYTFGGSAQLSTAQKKLGTASLYFPPISNASFLDEDMSVITDWTQEDYSTGVSSQVTFDSKSCMKLLGGTGTIASYGSRYIDVGTFGARTVFSMNVYIAANGTYLSDDNLIFVAYDGTYYFIARFGSNGVYTDVTGGSQSKMGDVTVGAWQEWTFDVTWGSTVDVYLNQVLQHSGMPIAVTTANTNGVTKFIQYGYHTPNMISYIDWIRVGSTFADSHIYLTDSDDWDFGTGDFTIDFWFRMSDVTRDQIPLQHYENGNNIWYLDFYVSGTHKLAFYVRTGSVVQGYYVATLPDIVNDTWYHFAFERTTTTAKCFLDGTSLTLTEYTAFGTNDLGNIGAVLDVGRYASGNNNNYFLGYIDELRISKGIARWTSNFTPPTVPYVNTFEITPNITSANAWQTITWDISGVTDSDKDAIDKVIVTVVNADAANTFYVDNFITSLSATVNPSALTLTATPQPVVISIAVIVTDGVLNLALYAPTVYDIQPVSPAAFSLTSSLKAPTLTYDFVLPLTAQALTATLRNISTDIITRLLSRGYTFGVTEQVTHTKLTDLIESAVWQLSHQATGDMLYFNGTDWVRIPAGSNGKVLTLSSGVPTWA